MIPIINREELEAKLLEAGVNPRCFSLYDELRPDCTVLYENYSIWEVFYFSERGSRHGFRSFKSLSEACNYIFDQLTRERAIAIKHGLKY